jgi:hypothetical protein
MIMMGVSKPDKPCEAIRFFVLVILVITSARPQGIPPDYQWLPGIPQPPPSDDEVGGMDQSVTEIEQSVIESYVHDIANTDIQTLVRLQLDGCPYTPLCNFTSNLQFELFSPNKEPCCSSCMCDSSCTLLGNCCPDKVDSISNISEKKLYNCVYAQLRPWNETNVDGKSFIMVNKCPPDYDDDEAIVHKCESPSIADDITLADHIPVGTLLPTVTYSNKYCALCNGLSSEEIVYWGVKMTCRSTNTMALTDSIKELLNSIQNGPSCNILFEELSRPDIHECNPDILITDLCNQTGLWDIYDPVWEAGCKAYTSLYRNANNRIYRNVVCYMCNRKTIVTQAPLRSCSRTHPPREMFLSFSALLNLNADYEAGGDPDETEHNRTCSDGFVYDVYKVGKPNL